MLNTKTNRTMTMIHAIRHALAKGSLWARTGSRWRNGVLRLLAWQAAICCNGAPTVLNFEDLADSTPVGNTYQALGILFNDATAIMSGISLNEAEFPPHSGFSVVYDDGGPVEGSFDSAVRHLSLYATYTEPITLYGYDQTHHEVVVAHSLFSENTVSTGNTPNEYLELSFPAGIWSFAVQGSLTGFSFVLDDLEFSTAGVPDQGTPLAVLLPLWAILTTVGATAGRRPLTRGNPTRSILRYTH